MSYREDDLTRSETNCLVNCFNKNYRFMAFANTLYTYIVNGEKVDEYLNEDTPDDNMDFGKQIAAAQESMANKIA
jgi:hypothetical protein